jgi:hypothetical protein
VLDFGNFRYVSFLEESLDRKSMPSEEISLERMVSEENYSYPLDPANLKLFGNSRLKAAQKSGVSDSVSLSTEL